MRIGVNNQISRKLLFGDKRKACNMKSATVKIAIGTNAIKYIKLLSIEIRPIVNLIKVIIKAFRSDDPTTLAHAGDRALAARPT